MKYELCAYKTDKLSLESTIKAKIYCAFSVTPTFLWVHAENAKFLI